jgi:hypothetical protein
MTVTEERPSSSTNPAQPEAQLADYTRSGLDMLRAHPEMILGTITWFSIPEHGGLVSHADLTGWFAAAGLDAKYLPRLPQPMDCFRAASGELARRPAYPHPAGNARLRVVEVHADDEVIIRYLMRDLVDTGSSATVSTARVATLRLFRGAHDPMTGRRDLTRQHVRTEMHSLLEAVGPDNKPVAVAPVPMGAVDREQVQAALDAFDVRYTQLRSFLQGQAVRAVVRNYLRAGMQAISVKPASGVYYVHTVHQAVIDALQSVLTRISGCSMHQLPLLDLPEQRQMLMTAFEDEVEKEIQGLLDEIAKLGGRERIPAKLYAALTEQYQRLLDQADMYSEILQVSQDRAGAALELAMTGLAQLGRSVKA